MKQREGTIFNLKPELTLAMKLAASFAIAYYGLLLIYEVFTLVYSRYFIDSYYFNQDEAGEGTRQLWIQIAQLALSIILVFSLIQIFRKKVHGKAIFVPASLALIVFQFLVTGPVPLVKYILEVLLVLIIAPIRVKKKLRLKDGKLQLETVEQTENQPTESSVETELPKEAQA
ncbi:MAG: hypothetical protein IJ057_12195 [Bacteroidales bacterium]|nr:hypothetical protein [Bacteroidales bacterium]